MYRIMVVSDTHRHIEHIVRTLDNIKAFDMIIHLGDNTVDADNLKKLYPGKELISVKGNTDLSMEKAEVFCEIEGKKFFITHGHLYGVKTDLFRIYMRGEELGAEVILFGHTHIPLCEKKENILMLNPGGHNSYSRSIGIIEIEEGVVKGCLYPC